jgi:AhpD family alkylhydroperoxidase
LRSNHHGTSRLRKDDFGYVARAPSPASLATVRHCVGESSASACLRCDDCIIYHAIQGYRLGVTRAEREELLNVALVVGGSIVIPHLRRAYELLEELYG